MVATVKPESVVYVLYEVDLRHCVVDIKGVFTELNRAKEEAREYYRPTSEEWEETPTGGAWILLLNDGSTGLTITRTYVDAKLQ